MDNNIHFLLGALAEADRWIDYHQSRKSQFSRRKLKEAKIARQEVVDKINKLADSSIVIPLGKDGA